MFIQGKKITDSELKMLKEESSYILRTRLWSILTNSLKDQAKKSMFERSKSWEDMLFGKAMLYNLDVQEKIIELIEK